MWIKIIASSLVSSDNIFATIPGVVSFLCNPSITWIHIFHSPQHIWDNCFPVNLKMIAQSIKRVIFLHFFFRSYMFSSSIFSLLSYYIFFYSCILFSRYFEVSSPVLWSFSPQSGYALLFPYYLLWKTFSISQINIPPKSRF